MRGAALLAVALALSKALAAPVRADEGVAPLRLATCAALWEGYADVLGDDGERVLANEFRDAAARLAGEAEADALIALAAARGLVLMVGQIERHSAAVRTLRTGLADRGLRAIEAVRVAPFRPRSLDVSVVLDLMIHDLDLILSLVPSPLDEVRAVGAELGLPEAMVWRQPFPGPGLGIRIIGEVTAERLETLRAADAIAREELTAAGLDRTIWQCPVVLLADVRSVGVQGDGRTYGHPIVLRPVSSEDAMTADWTRMPYDVLATISTRITNEVPEVNRVVLDVTSKPPGTIEWE